MDLLMGLGRSVGLLAVVSIAYTHVIRYLPAGRLERTLVLGLLFAAGAVGSMLTPTVLAPGIFIDARSVLIGLSALFGGPVAALVAGTLAGAFRLWQGGVGALAGVVGIAATTLTGIAFERALRHRAARLGTPELLLLGAVVGPMNLSGVVLLPDWGLIGQVLGNAALPLLTTSLLGVLFLGTLMLHERERLAMETALAESERRFRTVFSGVRDVVFRTDRAGAWTLLNPAWTDLTGWTVEESLGTPLMDTVHPDDREKAEALFEALTAGWLQHSRQELRIRTRDGRWRWTELNARRAELADGPEAGMSGTLKDITQRREAEQALRESRRRFQEIASVLTEGVYVVNDQDVIEYVNPAAEEMLGWRHDELLGRNAHETFHHMHRDGTPFPSEACPVHQAIVAGRRFTTHVDHFVRKDGGWLPVALAAAPLVRDGKVYGAVAAFHEISERLRQQQILRESEERYRLLFNSSLDAVFVYHLGPDGAPSTFVDVNDVACERLGYPREELLKRTPADICDPEGAVEIPRLIADIRRDGYGVFERVHVAADGRRIPVETSARLFRHKGNTAVIAISRDITERKRAEERIHRLAHYDALTDLPNRRLLMDRLDRAVALAARHGRAVAVLMLDLDGFKPVNDTYGHDVGDELLAVIARRLESAVRRADTIARLGGDEFVLVLSEVGALADAEMVASKVIAVINDPVELAGTAIHVGASIGIAVFPEDGRDPAALMKAADQAMYRAKADGRNQYAVRTPA
ncbi:MAG TPA: PAS domain S-box protein [Azospirillum sp.]|nr:PAS domain S-box protein [Azospirillum sp.]